MGWVAGAAGAVFAVFVISGAGLAVAEYVQQRYGKGWW